MFAADSLTSHMVFEAEFRDVVSQAGGIEHLLEHGYVQIDYNPAFLSERAPIIVEGLARMIKDHALDFQSDIIGHDEAGWKHDSGLWRRNEREEKWFFHVFAQTRERMQKRGAPVEKYELMFKALEDLNRRALLHAQLLGKMYDEYHESRGIVISHSLARAFDNGYAVSRALRYLMRAIGRPDATTHFDRSGFTTHWWGSRQGLIVIDRSGRKLRIDETAFDRILLFPGKKFGAVTNYHYGPGTLHGVVDTARDSGESSDRYALPTFVHPTLTKREAQHMLAYEDDCKRMEDAAAL